MKTYHFTIILWIISAFQSAWAGDPLSGSWSGTILGDPVELALWHNDRSQSDTKWWLWNGILHSPKHKCYIAFYVNMSKQNDKETSVSMSSNSEEVRSQDNCSQNVVTRKNFRNKSILNDRSILKKFSIKRRKRRPAFSGSNGKFQLNDDSSVLTFQFQELTFKGLKQNRMFSYDISLRRAKASASMLSYVAALKSGTVFDKPKSVDIALLKTKKRTMANLYTMGKNFDKDSQAANKNLILAQKGDKDAQFRIGYSYEHGIGITKDDGKALHWYLKAVENGQFKAMFTLALFYQDGRGGLSRDLDKAVYWFTQSAEGGVPEAQYNLALFYQQGNLSLSKDYAKALHWYLKAAENGSYIAANNIGVMFKRGYGLPSDPWMAYLWYDFAAKNGDETASINLRAMNVKIPSQQTNEVKLAKNKINFSKLKKLTLTAQHNRTYSRDRPGYFEPFGDCGNISCNEQFTNSILINYYY